MWHLSLWMIELIRTLNRTDNQTLTDTGTVRQVSTAAFTTWAHGAVEQQRHQHQLQDKHVDEADQSWSIPVGPDPYPIRLCLRESSLSFSELWVPGQFRPISILLSLSLGRFEDCDQSDKNNKNGLHSLPRLQHDQLNLDCLSSSCFFECVHEHVIKKSLFDFLSL